MKRSLILMSSLALLLRLPAQNIPDSIGSAIEAEAIEIVDFQDSTFEQIEVIEADFPVMPDSLFTQTTLDTRQPFEPLKPIDISLPINTDKHGWVSPYALPYSRHATGGRNWHRMWINTAVLSGAFVGTLFVLELLPEDATAWNRAEIQKTPMFERWYRNIFVRNPEIDHDKFIFNYVLHPYAGAAYFMSARSCGFSFWGSFLYSFCISTFGWEFGIEAFMERPSYQDLVVTPAIGSIFGELMYKGKRAIVERNYDVIGSSFFGHFLCFLLDPVNEVVDLFRGNPCHDIGRQYAKQSARTESTFAITPNSLSLCIRF